MTFSEPIPFDVALDFLRQKKLLPTSLSSAQLRELQGELTRRAFFSARVEQAEVLEKAQALTQTIAGQLTEQVVGPDGQPAERVLSIPEAKAQLREFLQSTGYQAKAGEEDSIKDLLSDRRLSLIVETNVLDAQGYAKHQANQDQDVLDVNPAWELVRIVNSEHPRDWEERWAAAIEATTSEGATAPGSGRMVALKNHPIWQALGDGAGGYEDTLGNPWPPFAFNSGMNVIDVPRDEAVALGIMEDNTRVPLASESEPDGRDFNDGLEADASRFSPALQSVLAEQPGLELRNGVLTVAGRRAA